MRALPRAGALRGADSSGHHYHHNLLPEDAPLIPLTIKHPVTIISPSIMQHLNHKIIVLQTTRKPMRIWLKLSWQSIDSRKGPLDVHTMLRAMKRCTVFRTCPMEVLTLLKLVRLSMFDAAMSASLTKPSENGHSANHSPTFFQDRHRRQGLRSHSTTTSRFTRR